MGYGRDIRKVIGERITALRVERKLTQKQLAEALGVTQSFVNKLESGIKAVPDVLMDRLLETLGASQGDIIVEPRLQDTKVGSARTKEISDAVFGAPAGVVALGLGLLHYFMKGSPAEQVALLQALQGMVLARNCCTITDLQFLMKVKTFIQDHASDSEADEEEEMHG